MVEIKIYTKNYCPYCHRAKMLLDSLNLKYDEVEINSQSQMSNLVEKTKMMTVPQIFINDKLIGGCDELFDLNSSGKLKEFLN